MDFWVKDRNKGDIRCIWKERNTDLRNCSNGCKTQRQLETTRLSNLFFFSYYIDYLFPTNSRTTFLFSFKQCTCASGPFLPGIVLAKQRPMNEHSRITPSNCCGSRKSTNLSFSFSFVKMPNVSFRHLPVKSMTGSYQIDN